MAKASAALCLVTATALAGCSFAPAYQAPPAPAIAAYKEAPGWTPAAPADALPREGWWRIFDDETLDRLERRATESNPTLAAALARDQQAQAYLAAAQGAAGPRVGLTGGISRNRQSDNRPLRGAGQPDEYAADALGLQIGYELDLWGRVRNLVAAQKAETEASQADLAAIRLSLQASLADAYVRLRGLDAETDLLSQTVKAYDRTFALTRRRHEEGLASKLDLDRALTLLESAKAQLAETHSRRALLEHALASLVGEPASRFSLAPDPTLPPAPSPPAVVPSELLQRRPDVAAAERRMAAANARIGVARAAFFPVVSLDASGGYQNTGGPNLITAPNSYWGIGPNLAALLFDGGRRKALERAAQAQFDQTASDYRGRVLKAFQDVEDGLALQRHLAKEAEAQARAVQAAVEAQDIAQKRYQRGVISYLELVTAQTAALNAQQGSVDVTVRRAQASVRLVRALGGGWTAPQSDDLVSVKAAASAHADTEVWGRIESLTRDRVALRTSAGRLVEAPLGPTTYVFDMQTPVSRAALDVGQEVSIVTHWDGSPQSAKSYVSIYIRQNAPGHPSS